MKASEQNTKKLFRKLGTCSRTLFYILNREFGYQKENEERAADPLAGGIMQKGHQCGMLWGSSMAAGAESFRRCKDPGQAIGLAITTTQGLMESYSKRTKCINCRDFTNTDFSRMIELVKYLLFKARFCFDLAEKWAPEAIESAKKGLTNIPTDTNQQAISCASEVARKMGASDEEMLMVAGFAGGMGLSGNGCGALGAAVWMNSLDWLKSQNGKSAYSNPKAKNTLKVFTETTGSEFLCHKICGRRFKTLDEHSEFIKNGGCEELIDVLSQS